MEQHCISNKDINIARDNMKCHAISGLSELAKNSRSSTFLVHKLYVPSLTAQSRGAELQLPLASLSVEMNSNRIFM